MIYLLAVVSVALICIIWRMWPRPVPMPAPDPQAEEVVQPVAPRAVWRDEFAFAHFNESRRKYAADIDEESQRLVRKLESVRQAMNEDIAALKRMRAETDAAKAEAMLMREQKRDAEQVLEQERVELRAAISASQQASQRIDELNQTLGTRDGEIAMNRAAMLVLEADHKTALQSLADSNEALAQHGLSLNEAQLKVARLEQALFERDEENEVQARQLEKLRADATVRREQIEALEAKIAKLIERFEDARRESLLMFGNLRAGQQQATERAERLETDSEAMRRHIVETERARDRLLGQVGQLRAENAGLRAESQVKLRDLETVNNELTANIAVLERMLASTRTVRAQPAPARAHLRLIAEAKKAPGRAFGS